MTNGHYHSRTIQEAMATYISAMSSSLQSSDWIRVILHISLQCECHLWNSMNITHFWEIYFEPRSVTTMLLLDSHGTSTTRLCSRSVSWSWNKQNLEIKPQHDPHGTSTGCCRVPLWVGVQTNRLWRLNRDMICYYEVGWFGGNVTFDA